MAYILNKLPVVCRITLRRDINAGVCNRIESAIGRVRNLNKQHFFNKSDHKIEQRFRLLDNITDDYNLVYREHKYISMSMIAAYNLGWIGLLVGSYIVAYVIIKDPPEQKERIEGVSAMLKPLSKVKRNIMISASFLVSVLLIVVSKTVPFRIYHNPSQKLYKAIFASNLLQRKKVLIFSEGTAIPRFKRVRFMQNSLFDVNGYTVLLDIESFQVPFIREQMLKKN